MKINFITKKIEEIKVEEIVFENMEKKYQYGCSGNFSLNDCLKNVILMFTINNCAPCNSLKEVLKNLKEDEEILNSNNSDCNLIIINVSEEKNLNLVTSLCVKKLRIKAMPTLYILKKQEEKDNSYNILSTIIGGRSYAEMKDLILTELK